MNKMTGKSCGHCGYELTGLSEEGQCPECGAYYDVWSGRGLANDKMAGHRRGDQVVKVIQTLGLLFLGILILGVGAVYTWKTDGLGPLILCGVVSVIFFISTVVSGLSLRKR